MNSLVCCSEEHYTLGRVVVEDVIRAEIRTDAWKKHSDKIPQMLQTVRFYYKWTISSCVQRVMWERYRKLYFLCVG